MMTDGKLAAWLATAKPGSCPCKRKIPKGRRTKLCGAEACRKKYDALYQQDRAGPTSLREVLSVEEVEGKPRHRRVTLSCKHHEDMPRSLARRVGARRRCPTCDGDEV